MPHTNNRATCPHCNTPLDNWERIRRRLWQKILLPGKDRFKCSNCGKKVLIQRNETPSTTGKS